ncbi:MAG: glycosyltransferase family 2 protein [Phycisphaeraceae bacterium]|nr:glycosyltransferase family 2 protein [Phycisphaeraceae bacterium]
MVRASVTVCLPAYAHPEGVRRALTSVASQTLQPLEVIVTDDTPDDSVKRVVTTFADNLNIRYQRNAERLGSPENWNAGLRLAKGQYVKILHHDDWLRCPDSLEQFAEMLDREPAAAIACSATEVTDCDGKPMRIHAPDSVSMDRVCRNPGSLLIDNLVGSPSATMVRNGTATEYDRALVWYVDVPYYIDILKKHPRLMYTSEPLVNTTSGMSTSMTTLCREDPRLQIREFLYVANRLSARGMLHRSHWKCLARMCVAWNIQGEMTLLDCGATRNQARAVARHARWWRLRLGIYRFICRWAGKPQA